MAKCWPKVAEDAAAVAVETQSSAQPLPDFWCCHRVVIFPRQLGRDLLEVTGSPDSHSGQAPSQSACGHQLSDDCFFRAEK